MLVWTYTIVDGAIIIARPGGPRRDVTARPPVCVIFFDLLLSLYTTAMLTVYKKRRISDPSKLVNGFFGPVGEYGFNDHYREQFERIQDTLPEQLKLSHIYAGDIEQKQPFGRGGDKVYHNRTWAAKSENGSFWWRKYESGLVGSGCNHVYYLGNRYNTRVWLEDQPFRESLLNQQ
jgi:hypothetical protein